MACTFLFDRGLKISVHFGFADAAPVDQTFADDGKILIGRRIRQETL